MLLFSPREWKITIYFHFPLVGMETRFYIACYGRYLLRNLEAHARSGCHNANPTVCIRPNTATYCSTCRTTEVAIQCQYQRHM
ncbi:hypothetical protein GDO78_002534 [Eleutherodactylus coqui]|uniref:Uncharacterized protein n=1 Tax=Eleutherodactylus coqui TaxID=57060 RepID=A0A8J6K2S2_ELECQ|nr:hypothetical protein GDO78_002534 [Eleutherodactylus coqui]